MHERTGFFHQWRHSAIRAARTAWQSVGSTHFGTWLCAGFIMGVFLAMVGALESYKYSIGFRLGFWTGLCLIGSVIAAAIEWGLSHLSRLPKSGLVHWIILILLFGLVMTPIAYLANASGGWPPLSDLFMYLQNSMAVSAALVGLNILFLKLRGAPAMRGDDRKPAATAFAQRLTPAIQQARIIAVKSEGHYVQVWTDQGKDMILLRMKDAVSELATLDGAQVHRSWWVSRGSVCSVRRNGGRVWLILDNDIEVPVSRPNVRVLKDAGWW